jgi:hypothetical protein
MFSKALLLMQTEELYGGINSLTKDIILKVWVKLKDSILYHTTNEILPPKMVHFTFVHTMTHLLHITAHLSENYGT